MALDSDIEAMFHQVRVDPKDHDDLSFFGGPMMIYQSSQWNIVWGYTSLGVRLHQVALALASERLLKTRLEISPEKLSALY